MTTPSIPTSQAFTHDFRHVQPRWPAFAAPTVGTCRSAGFHLPPHGLAFAAPPVAIWRLPSAANPNRMNHSSRNRDFNMLD